MDENVLKTFFKGYHTFDVASGKYAKILNGVKAAKENHAHKERTKQDVASTATEERTNGSSRRNRSSRGDHCGSSHWSSRKKGGQGSGRGKNHDHVSQDRIIMDAIGTDKTFTAAIITSITGIMAGVMMTSVSMIMRS